MERANKHQLTTKHEVGTPPFHFECESVAEYQGRFYRLSGWLVVISRKGAAARAAQQFTNGNSCMAVVASLSTPQATSSLTP